MKIKCDNADNGCEWIGELRALDEHIITCDYAFLSCPNECVVGNKILRKNMEKHKMEECPRRQYVCPHCEESGEYEERTTTHLEECLLLKIPCSNEGCSYLVARCELTSHCNKCCEFEMIPCKYAEIGCTVKFPRKDLKHHEEDRQQHLELAIDATPNLELQIREQRNTILELEETVKKQGIMLAQLQDLITVQSKEINEVKEAQICDGKSSSNGSTQIHHHTFKFTNYAKHKSKNDHVYSPPFYSSPGGYKLCIKVYANGTGKGEGSHLSVYAFLMRGDNDNHLPWPFTGTVEIELLNQLDDGGHHSTKTDFGKPGRGERVKDGDRASTGYGQPKYIVQSALDYLSFRNCQYLKDDCLYFRMSVNCTPTPKPWLSTVNVF